MHVPDAFSVDDAEALEMVRAADFGELVTAGKDGLSATPLPLLHREGPSGPPGTIVTHVSRLNDQWRGADGAHALISVRGADGYVRNAWYPSKERHGRVVPTWNYVAIHIHGHLTVHHDLHWLEVAVRGLTDKHEAAYPDRWSVDHAPEAFVRGQLRALVGLELTITRLDVKVKMSQNRPPEDIAGVIGGLRATGRSDLAALVQERTPALP